MRSNFGEVAQIFKLKRVGGVPKDHQFAPLPGPMAVHLFGGYNFITTSLEFQIYFFLTDEWHS